jgi:hypothetical protein
MTRPTLPALAAALLALLPMSAAAATEPGSAAAARDGPAAADGRSAAADAFADFLALMREIARAEGRISDLRKDRDEALARLRAGAPPQPAGSQAAAPGDGPPTDTLSARIDAVEARFAADMADAEQRLRSLEQQRAAVESRRP